MIGDAPGGLARGNLEDVIEPVWTSNWSRSMDGMPGAETLFVG